MLRTRRRHGVRAALAVGAVLVVSGCFPAIPRPSASSATPTERVAAEVFAQLNAERAARGLHALRWDADLAGMAQNWSGLLADSGQFKHRNLGPMFDLPPFNTGKSALGENILRGPAGLRSGAMTRAWMRSSGHRHNILSPGFNSVGIGVVCRGGAVYVTQNFGRDAGNYRSLGTSAGEAPIVTSGNTGSHC